MGRNMFKANSVDVDGPEQPDGGLSPGAAEGPALAGQAAGAEDGAGAVAAAAQRRAERVQRPADGRLVHRVLQRFARVHHSRAGRLQSVVDDLCRTTQ